MRPKYFKINDNIKKITNLVMTKMLKGTIKLSI
jgi:hypothetical protein